MSKARYSLAQEAEADLIDIARHTAARWRLEQQRIYIVGLYLLFDDIAEQPLLGAARPELGFLTRMRRYERGHTVYCDYAEGVGWTFCASFMSDRTTRPPSKVRSTQSI